MSDRPLRIIHVEDNANDHELVMATLAADGFVAELRRVESAAALDAALRDPPIDLVIADYSLPGYDGMRALDQVRAFSPLLPFIVVTGTIGEEKAVDALKRGATDFVLKHRLERLGPAVRRALAEVQLRIERERAEAALRASEAELRSTFDNAPIGMVILGSDGTMRRANRALAAMLEATEAELEGHILSEFVDAGERPASGEAIRRLFATGDLVAPVERRYRTKGGRLVLGRCTAAPVRDDTGAIVHALAMIEDVSDLHRAGEERVVLEGQLRQAQKMEAVGQLTGGMAHDFNNILTVMMANAQLAVQDLHSDQRRIREDLEALVAAGHRGKELISKLLGFSRRQPLRIEPVVVAALLDDFGRTVRRLLPSNITVETSVAADLPPVLADSGSLEQMLLNLATNSRDAMPAGGRLVLSAHTGPAPATRAGASGAEGTFVCIEVKDTGDGMDEATLHRLFEPFFTTKPAGQGTGLGMAMIYGLTKQHRGFVEVASSLGAGTAVQLFLPAFVGPMRPAPAHPRATPPGVPVVAGTATVLVAEDEPAIRRVAQRALEGIGLHVLTATDGADAQAQIAAGAQVDLIVSDHMMPGQTGLDLYRALRGQGNAVPFIVTSGYSVEEIWNSGFGAEVQRLAKPWTVEELRALVASMLAK